MQLMCPVFEDGGIIPSLYTCEGKNKRPPLDILSPPAKAVSLVLIMDDPDVPRNIYPEGVFDHWVLFNLPPSLTRIDEEGPIPGTHGRNSNGKNEYTAPCPPDREHRYFFKLYALNKKLNLKEGARKEEVEKAMKGHVLAACQIIGRYEKGQGY